MSSKLYEKLRNIDENQQEKTFSKDETLPSLPVPDLERTLDKYLSSVKPHLDEKDYHRTEFLVRQFASGIGKQLHQQLLAKAQKEKNWLEIWWENFVYLSFREPLCVSNFAGPGPYMYHTFPARSGSQLEVASVVCYYTLEFWNALREEKWPIDTAGDTAFAMHQYRGCFNTCRIPEMNKWLSFPKDRLRREFRTAQEGSCPDHVLIICNGRAFCVRMVNKSGQLLTPDEIKYLFGKIQTEAKRAPGPGIGVLTGAHRDTWAEAREHLLTLDRRNERSLDMIESSAFCMSLTDWEPRDENELLRIGMTDGLRDRWQDKSMSFNVYANGLVCTDCDHSPYDAMALVAMSTFHEQSMIKCKGKPYSRPVDPSQLFDIQELTFVIDSKIEAAMQLAASQRRKYTDDLSMLTQRFTSFGKDWLKTQRFHPDVFCQMALQLAYYRLYNRPACTYETATTRKFYHGRTETMRSCTPEVVEWAQSMLNSSVPDTEKLRKMKHSAATHMKLMSEAQSGLGCDRHLLGLYIICLEQGLEIPELYQDPAWRKSGGSGNFVLSTSCVGYTNTMGGVTPMCHHGYGAFYRIGEQEIQFYVSDWKSYTDTDSKKFFNSIVQSMEDMRALMIRASSHL